MLLNAWQTTRFRCIMRCTSLKTHVLYAAVKPELFPKFRQLTSQYELTKNEVSSTKQFHIFWMLVKLLYTKINEHQALKLYIDSMIIFLIKFWKLAFYCRLPCGPRLAQSSNLSAWLSNTFHRKGTWGWKAHITLKVLKFF